MEEEHKRHKKDDPDLSDAMSYLTRVKEEYKDDPSVYDHFLELMRDYKQGKNDAVIIVRAVEQLFKGKKYLVDGFSNFLPRAARDDRIHDRFVERGGIDRFNDRADRFNDTRFGDIRPGDRGVDRLNDMRINDRLMHDRYAHERIADRPIPIDRSLCERVDRGLIPTDRSIINVERNNERNVVGNERANMERNSDVKNERGQFESKYNRNPRPEDLGAQKKALSFIHKVKRRFADGSETYREFIRYLQQYQKMPGNADLVLNQLRGLLNGHEDLLQEFTDFLPQMRSRDSSEIPRVVQVKENREESLLIRTIHEVLKKHDILDPFAKLLNMFNQGCVTGKEFIILIEPILKNNELLKAFKNFIGYRDTDAPPHILRNLRTYQKIHSYRILPDHYREALCKGQEGIVKTVLNTYCMACPDRDGTFISSRKNSSEEILFKVEDERFECELQIMRVGDLITNLEFLASSIDKSSKEDLKDEIQPSFTLDDIDMPGGIVQELLTEIYRDKAIDILEGILNHPQISIPIVLKRLYRVLKKYKNEMKSKTRLWRETTHLNHYRANDAQSFIFREEKRDLINHNSYQEDITVKITDFDVINDIDDFYHSFNSGLVDSETVDLLEWVLGVFKSQNEIAFFTTPHIANIFRAFIILYDRLQELKLKFQEEGMQEEMKAKSNNLPIDNKNQDASIQSNIPVSEQLDLLTDEEMLKRDKSSRTYCSMVGLIKDSLLGIVDNLTFEERLRIITNTHGYKLFNIEKYFGKIDKMATSAMNDESSMNTVKLSSKNIGKFVIEAITDTDIFYLISKENDVFSIRIQEIEEDEKKDVIRDLVRLTPTHSENEPEKVFLERSKQNELNDVHTDFCLECGFENDKFKFVENTWDFLIKKGKKRSHESK